MTFTDPSSGVADKIFLADHIREVEIGAFNEERGHLQRLSFSVWVDVVGGANVDDDVDGILSYDTILEAIDAELDRERTNLLETLAEGIASRVLAAPLSSQVVVRIEKLDRVSGRLGVEITRRRPLETGLETQIGRPNVLCLAYGSALPTLPDGPNIIAVHGAPSENDTPDLTGLRLRLLASEQSAWELSAKHGALAVVATRTELSHSIKTGATVLWAPAKMVFDVSQGVDAMPTDFGEICAWLAELLDAKRLIYVGLPEPTRHGFSGNTSRLNA